MLTAAGRGAGCARPGSSSRPWRSWPLGLAYYRLDRNCRVLSAESGGNFAIIQRQLEAEKLVTPATRYRGERDLFPVRRWDRASEASDLITGPEGPERDAGGARSK